MCCMHYGYAIVLLDGKVYGNNELAHRIRGTNLQPFYDLNKYYVHIINERVLGFVLPVLPTLYHFKMAKPHAEESASP